MSELLGRIRRSDKVLYFCGWTHLFLLCLFLLAAPWDDRLVTNINPWIKPMKFALSITIYSWTVALLLGMLPDIGRARGLIRWGVAGTMTGEVLLIALQAARGVPSHFNVQTPFDAQVFGLMGLLILVNTLLGALLLFEFLWQEVSHPRPVVMGVRLALFVFLLASLEGMIIVLNQAHSVGGPDGGPGLPFLDWSTQYGDLRVAHAWGLHSLQALPLAAHLVSRRLGGRPLAIQLGAVAAVGLFWIGVFLFLFNRAMTGRPLITL